MVSETSALQRTCEALIQRAEDHLKKAIHHSMPKQRAMELEAEANGIIYAVRVLIDQYGLDIEIPAEFQAPETRI